MVEKQLDSFALAWIAKRSLLLAKSINLTTLDALRSLLSEGFAQGESISQLTKRIEGYFSENEKWRAEMVARTEVIGASNEGTLHRYELEGIKESEFLAAPDACAEECAPLDAQIFSITESHGMIPVHPNCRCTWLAVI